MWFFPYLSYAVIGAMVAVVVSMALVDEVRAQLWWSLGSLAVVLLAAEIHLRRREAPPSKVGAECSWRCPTSLRGPARSRAPSARTCSTSTRTCTTTGPW